MEKRKRDDDAPILKRVKSKIIGLNGPLKLHRLNGIDLNGKERTLYLFGEKHRENYCKNWIDAQPENIISFVNFLIRLIRLTKRQDIFLDIYVEIIGFDNKQYGLEGERLYTDDNGMITSIYKKFKNCIQTSTRNKCKGFRMHWADSRNTRQHSFVSFINFIQDILFVINKDISQKESGLSLICKKLSTNIIVQKYLESVELNDNIEDFSEYMISYILYEIDIVKKEYDQVDDLYKPYIFSFFKNQIESLMSGEYDNYRNKLLSLHSVLFLQNVLGINRFHNLLKDIAFNPINVALEANVMNIYTICRILKSYNIERLPTETNLEYESRIELEPSIIYNPQPESATNIIFYGGEKHVGVISDFFTTIPNFTKTVISESEEDTNCLKLDPDIDFFGNKLRDIVFQGEEKI